MPLQDSWLLVVFGLNAVALLYWALAPSALPWLVVALVCCTVSLAGPPFILLVAVLVGVLARHYPVDLLRRPYNIGLMAALFLCAALASALTLEVGPTLPGLLLWALAGVFYWTLSCVRGVLPHSRTVIWMGVMGGGLLCLGTSISQILAHVDRVKGPTIHANILAMVLNGYFPLMLMWGSDETELTPGGRILSIGMGTIMALLIIPTQSRLGLVVEGLSLLLVTAASLRSTRRAQKVAGLGAVMVVVLSLAFAWPRILERIRTAPPSDIGDRLVYNRVAQAMSMTHPLGVGLGKFPSFAGGPAYRSLLGHTPLVECHNAYWEIAAETGWAGEVLFLAVGVRFWLLAWRGAAAAGFRPSLYVGIVIGYIALAINSLGESGLVRSPGLLVALTLAVLSLPAPASMDAPLGVP